MYDNLFIKPENKFKIFYFNVIIYGAISSINEWFIQFEKYNDNFGFLYNLWKLRMISDNELMKHCLDL